MSMDQSHEVKKTTKAQDNQDRKKKLEGFRNRYNKFFGGKGEGTTSDTSSISSASSLENISDFLDQQGESDSVNQRGKWKWDGYNDKIKIKGKIPSLPVLDKIPLQRQLEKRFSPYFAANERTYRRYIVPYMGGDYLTRPRKEERLQAIDEKLVEAKSYIRKNKDYLSDGVRQEYKRLSHRAKIYREGTRGEFIEKGEKTSINKYFSEAWYKKTTEKIMGMKEQLEDALWPQRVLDTKAKINQTHFAFWAENQEACVKPT